MPMSSPETILIVDDDEKICELLTEFLQQNGYKAFFVQDGKGMFSTLSEQPIDLVLLDVMLLGENGITLCKKLRQYSSIPIIMVTAVDDDIEQVVALEVGADNYITKPFNSRILLAHIKSLLRREELSKNNPEDKTTSNDTVYDFCDWRLHTKSRQLLSPEGIDISLSTAEYNLLYMFLCNSNQVMSRDQLLNAIAGRTADPFDRIIDVLVNYIRKKLKDNSKKPAFIKTVHNVGYVFIAKVTKLNESCVNG